MSYILFIIKKNVKIISHTQAARQMCFMGYSLPMLLPSHFRRVRLCATPWTAAHQAPPSLGFSRQEHWSGLPFPSPMRESEVAQSCPTLCDPTDCSPPGSSIHGILQARTLEWGATAFSEFTYTSFLCLSQIYPPVICLSALIILCYC